MCRLAKKKETEAEAARKQLAHYAADLRTTLARTKHMHRQLQEAYHDTIQKLVLAAEFKDQDTGAHISRMCAYSAILAEQCGLPKNDVQNLFYAAPMHDVGKIGIPDHIIMKPARLTAGEMAVMKQHTLIGSKILADSEADILKLAREIALWHHEKWNGTGYPHGLKRTKIPIMCRIVAVSDVFDALTSRRPYKKAFSVDESCSIIKNESGRHFDPDITDVFFRTVDRIVTVKKDTAKKKVVAFEDLVSNLYK